LDRINGIYRIGGKEKDRRNMQDMKGKTLASTLCHPELVERSAARHFTALRTPQL
jgi:hypothetical protein